MKGQQIWSFLVFKSFFGADNLESRPLYRVPCLNFWFIWFITVINMQTAFWSEPCAVIHHGKFLDMPCQLGSDGNPAPFDRNIHKKGQSSFWQEGCANIMHLSDSSLSLIADGYFSSIKGEEEHLPDTQPGGSHSNRFWQGRLRHNHLEKCGKLQP